MRVRAEMPKKAAVPGIGPGSYALSIGKPALRRVAGPRPQASVHSSYRGALNLMTKRGLVSVVPAGAGKGPLNINVGKEVMARLWPRAAGEEVGVGKNALSFRGGPTILLDEAEVFAPTGRFERAPLSAGTVARNVSVMKACAIREGRLGGLGALLTSLEPGGPMVPLNLFGNAALPGVRELEEGIRTSDRAAVKLAAGRISGLGIGLTPSGDDLLSGLMVAIVNGSANGMGPRNANELASSMVEASKGRTTTMSFEYLRQAAKGLANERIMRLVETVYTGAGHEVREATLEAIKIGETSGTDSVVGVWLGARAALGLHSQR